MREIVLLCPQAHAEALADFLLEEGVLSVSVEDADGDTEAEVPLFGEPGLEPEVQAWHRNRVVALLPDDLAPEPLARQAHRQGWLAAANDWTQREVPDTDWVRLTQSQFGPIEVGSRIWITPSWHEDDAAPQSLGDGADTSIVRIRLDPGLAFGTGSHPTTHLCLEWLAENLEPGQTVLDYGCGSGILAIAARLLGAGRTQGVDIDEQAVQSTQYNAEVNGVELDAMLPDALPQGTVQVVVANILSNPLKVLAPMLANRVAQGGRLVLSGVLERQADEVIAAYAPWIEMQVWQAREGWVCLHGRRA
ncbi:50S ribosomal protein L11 methyltransferase [Paracandidimonas soli]|uniref:Ribosomal protein L11 methyltransferase n=1 Tax=Paracandidimonas soli TaxID=1917182 RepID=A0A4R3V4P6_9BURK|nr:50S ribosomal protein L11 methyltransferase [Paracandidimonas soli]TCU98511.1 [LSU ribosomal protein L11P]-lysine N-methyltransferase [Paracandidimonas soli]